VWLPQNQIGKAFTFTAGRRTFIACGSRLVASNLAEAVFEVRLGHHRTRRKTYRHTVQPRFERVCLARFRSESATMAAIRRINYVGGENEERQLRGLTENRKSRGFTKQR
jgi:hypothetical protein